MDVSHPITAQKTAKLYAIFSPIVPNGCGASALRTDALSYSCFVIFLSTFWAPALALLLAAPLHAADKQPDFGPIHAARDAGAEPMEKLVREFAADFARSNESLGYATVCLANLDPRRALDTLAAQASRGSAHQQGICAILLGLPGVEDIAPLWLRAHPDDQAFDTVAACLVRRIFWRDPLAAKHWAARIKGATLRAFVQAAL